MGAARVLRRPEADASPAGPRLWLRRAPAGPRDGRGPTGAGGAVDVEDPTRSSRAPGQRPRRVRQHRLVRGAVPRDCRRVRASSGSRGLASRCSTTGSPSQAARAPRRSAAPPVRIGYVGTLAWHKGAHVLVEAARACSPAHSRFTSTATRPRSPSPRSLCARRGDRAAGRVPWRVRAGASRERSSPASTCKSVPSLWPENSPLVIHDASLSGTPVVGADTGGIPSPGGCRRHGLRAISAPALAARLQPLIDRPEGIGRLAAGIPAVKSIEDDQREWAGRYARLLSDARAPSRARA